MVRKVSLGKVTFEGRGKGCYGVSNADLCKRAFQVEGSACAKTCSAGTWRGHRGWDGVGKMEEA